MQVTPPMTALGLILLVFSALLGISAVVGLLLLCFARSRLRILGLLLLALPVVLVQMALFFELFQVGATTATF